MWLTPAVVNAAARSRSTRSRSPMRMPAASPASGSGSARVERLSSGPAESLDRVEGAADRADHLERPDRDGPDGADPAQVGPVPAVVVRQGSKPAGHGHPVPRHDRRVARQGGRHAGLGWLQLEGARLVPVARRADADDGRAPVPVARDREVRRGGRRHDREPQGDDERAERRLVPGSGAGSGRGRPAAGARMTPRTAATTTTTTASFDPVSSPPASALAVAPSASHALLGTLLEPGWLTWPPRGRAASRTWPPRRACAIAARRPR